VTMMDRLTDEGFHAGGLAVQSKAGVRDRAARLPGMLGPVALTGGIVGSRRTARSSSLPRVTTTDGFGRRRLSDRPDTSR
jgi:hypothetical protein